MPSATAREFQRAAVTLGFVKRRQTGSHERWTHPDGRAVTIPIHGGTRLALNIPIGRPRAISVFGLSDGRLERTTARGEHPVFVNDHLLVFSDDRSISSVDLRTKVIQEVDADGSD